MKIPPDCTVHIVRLPLAEGQEHNRIAIGKSGSQSVLEVKVYLRAISDAIGIQQQLTLEKNFKPMGDTGFEPVTSRV